MKGESSKANKLLYNPPKHIRKRHLEIYAQYLWGDCTVFKGEAISQPITYHWAYLNHNPNFRYGWHAQTLSGVAYYLGEIIGDAWNGLTYEYLQAVE